MEAAARHLTPVTLELGGKSPAIVAADADVGIAARRIAWGKFLNVGQTCIAPDYALVAAPVFDRFVDHLVAMIREFYGDDPSASPDYGRIVDDRHFARLSDLLADGRIVVGGERDASTRYFAPTVLVDVAPESAVMRDEIFGPVLPVLPVQDVEEAVCFVNARDRPLALYVFSESRATQDAVLDATQSGARVRQRDDAARGGAGPAVRRRRRERHRRLSRPRDVRDVHPPPRGAAPSHPSRPERGLPAVLGVEGAVDQAFLVAPATRALRSDEANVLRLFTLPARTDVELDRLPFLQGAVPAALNRREVDEHIGPVLARDEAVALLCVEPFHGSCRQRLAPLTSCACNSSDT